jgi:hypothetical protein
MNLIVENTDYTSIFQKSQDIFNLEKGCSFEAIWASPPNKHMCACVLFVIQFGMHCLMREI